MNVDQPGRRVRLPWESRAAAGARGQNDRDTVISRRVPLASMLPPTAKNHLVAMISEFVGTFMFLLFAFAGTNAVNTAPTASGDDLNADAAKLLYISLCFGMSLAVNAVSQDYSWEWDGNLANLRVIVGVLPYQRRLVQPCCHSGHGANRSRDIFTRPVSLHQSASWRHSCRRRSLRLISRPAQGPDNPCRRYISCPGIIH